MNKSKSIGKPVCLTALFAVLFCMDTAAVNNPMSYRAGLFDSDAMKYNGEYYFSGKVRGWL